jgi:dihydrodipicolinate synthase/N-acetylneuraminate lyase
VLGSVLACLLPVPAKYAGTNAGIRHYYHNVAYKSSDIDIFIYGLDEEGKELPTYYT